jgi:CubicO group peptidase (beta-lactamase class C family)
MKHFTTIPNPDLEVIDGNKSRWSHADNRRWGWHNLYQIARYGLTLRAARVMLLEKRTDLRIAELDSVRHFTSLPWFSGMVVVRGRHVLFERYAADFGKDRLHSIQSITKTMINLIIGQLVQQGILDLNQRISHYIPQIGSGYANATLQQALNMDVANEYSEDFTDPRAAYYDHEEAMGWRIPRDYRDEQTQHAFISGIRSDNITNRTGRIQYKDANTDVLGWVAELASGQSLRAFLTEIVDAAGLEGLLFISTDRDGVPGLDGGACLTARDLARYFTLFARRGSGTAGGEVGSAAFIHQSLLSGVPMSSPFEGICYSNHLMVSGRSVGHGGWGGQYALANLDTGVVGVFLSVIENEHANNHEYLGPVVRMLEAIASME